MGALCCCPRADEYSYSHCTFLALFFHQFFSRYGTIFHTLQGRSALSDVSENNSTTSSFDAPHIYSLSHRDALVSRKSMSHLQLESQPPLTNLDASSFPKWNHNKLAYVQTSSEDEDVCPTCLEEYIAENPKITMRCSHHFHLGCIYEWLERSESCPVCGKEMEFCEDP